MQAAAVNFTKFGSCYSQERHSQYAHGSYQFVVGRVRQCSKAINAKYHGECTLQHAERHSHKSAPWHLLCCRERSKALLLHQCKPRVSSCIGVTAVHKCTSVNGFSCACTNVSWFENLTMPCKTGVWCSDRSTMRRCHVAKVPPQAHAVNASGRKYRCQKVIPRSTAC